MKSRRKEILWLKDVQAAIQEIENHPKYLGGELAFEEDKYFRGWCYLQLARIGERMILIHKYWTIDDDVVWDTIEKDLPQLKAKIENWIKEKEEAKSLEDACDAVNADPDIASLETDFQMLE